MSRGGYIVVRNLMKSMQEKKEKEEADRWRSSSRSYYGKPANPYAWRENCEDNCIGIDPEDYETEEEYEYELYYAQSLQQEWIGKLDPRVKKLAEQFRIDPLEYAKYDDFQKKLQVCIDRYVEKIARQRYPCPETMEIPETAPYKWDGKTETFVERTTEMKISIQKKKIFLQETFELLKDNYKLNSHALWDLVGKMAKVDFSCAVEMWKILIRQYPDVLHNSDDFGFSIMYAMEKNIGEEPVFRVVSEDDFLKKSIFSELGDLRLSPTNAIRFYIFSDAITTANELLSLVYENAYKSNSFYDILRNAAYYAPGRQLSEEGFGMMMSWIAKVTNREEKAKLNLIMLDYMDDE